MVIIPLFVMVVAIIIFSFIGKREITYTTVGEVEPAGNTTFVQSTSSQPIKVNNLRENKIVHKGDLLVAYANDENSIQINSLDKDLNILNQRYTYAQQLKKGIESGKNTFTVPDEYGYSSQLNEYKSAARILDSDSNQKNQSIRSQNEALSSTREVVQDQISHNELLINDYVALKKAIMDGTPLAEDNCFIDSFNLYRARVESSPTEKNDITAQQINDVNNSIEQVKASINSLKMELTRDSTMPESDNINDRLDQLRSQYLMNVEKEIADLSVSILETQTKESLAKTTNANSSVLAQTDGTLHLNQETVGMSKVPNGTVLAQIYPILDERTKLNISIEAPVSYISSIQKGQTVRLSNYQHSEKPLILEGTVNEIASSPSRTEHGNYYKVSAKMALNHDQVNRVRYGYSGKAVIIIGEKTFFDFYKDIFLHDEY